MVAINGFLFLHFDSREVVDNLFDVCEISLGNGWTRPGFACFFEFD